MRLIFLEPHPLLLSSSHLSLKCANEARSAVLAFFKAPPEYTVIFTANATAALKLVGESYPFTGGSNYILGTDSHNSVSPELWPSETHQLIVHPDNRFMASGSMQSIEMPASVISNHCLMEVLMNPQRRSVSVRFIRR